MTFSYLVVGALGGLALLWVIVGLLWVYALYWSFRLWLSKRALRKAHAEVVVAEAELIVIQAWNGEL